jgi:site-specific DNA-methyltransferase (adenine-specific)
LIKREVTIGDCRLILGDCLEVLPTLGRVDAVVTDPPYGIALDTNNLRFSGGKGESQRKRGKLMGSAGGRPIVNDSTPFDPTHLLTTGKQQIIWGWHAFPDKLPRGSCLIWLKRNDDAFGSFLSDAELAWFSSGHGVYCTRDLSNAAIARERVHPTQKPLSLMSWCLGFIPKAQLILDPYMGSGTTGVAAMKAGKSFVGIEIDETFFDAAVQRVRNAYAQSDMFIPRAPEPKQEALL